MKNTILILAILFIIIISSVYGICIEIKADKRQIAKYNLEYEEYLNKTLLGTDIVTVMNKAINENEKNKIQKDEKGYYIENNENSIKIYLKMITINKTYPMEEFYNNDMTAFVKNFNLIEFKSSRSRISWKNRKNKANNIWTIRKIKKILIF